MIPGSTTSTPVGQITLARSPNPSGLRAEGRELFAETGRHGLLERSNVDVVTELGNLILARRAYELNTRAIPTADNMLESTTGLSR